MNTKDFAAKLRALANTVERDQTLQGWITYQPAEEGMELDVAAVLRVGDGQGSMVIWGNPNIAPMSLFDAAQTAMLALEAAEPFVTKHEPCGYYCDEDVEHIDHPITLAVGGALQALRRSFASDPLDARLIAAAPQLLEAVEQAAELIYQYHNIGALMGSDYGLCPEFEDCKLCTTVRNLRLVVARARGEAGNAAN